jgi:hypothetical protein
MCWLATFCVLPSWWLLLTQYSYHYFITCLTFSGQRKRAEINYETRTILSNGYLGSPIDEERSEMRYVMRIAEFSESSNL